MSAFGRHFTAVAACLALLTGCTGLLSSIDRDTGADNAHATRLLGRSEAGDNRASDADADADAVVVKDQLWLSGKTLKLTKTVALPPVFDEPASFDGTVDSLRTFADRISRLVHVPVKVAPSAAEAAARATEPAGMSNETGTGTPGTPPLPTGMLQAPGLHASASRRGASIPSTPVHIAYSGGTLHGLLDTATARFGVYWKYEGNAIVFFYTETRVFQVQAIPGDSSVATNVVSGASNSGGQSSSGTPAAGTTIGGGTGTTGAMPSVSSTNTDNIAMNAQLSVYNGLQTAIKAMLSPAGSVITTPATGSISVTDTPDALERIGEYMAQQNRVLSRQVLVNVTVLSVTLNSGDSYGIDWKAVYQALGTRFGITTAFTSLISSPNQYSATVISPSSRADATSAVISALSTQGSVRRKTSASLTTMNDQPVPVQVAEQQSYLAQISTTNTVNVGSETSLTPGSVTTGFNLTLLPHVLDDGTVMMQFYTNISSLVALQQFGSNGEEIQLPTVDTRNFLQRIAVKSGQTLVISGYEGITDQGNRQGVGTPSNYALGGGLNASRSREIIVVLLSPVVMNGA
ncbi:PilN family type IVB pilus formation outer membrane protein [Trinickia dinghuensis]|uniref:PilN family type IVB pilus formation outer membrane protein n=1 Tax=Trinickia dinghuensis TaxID=2291023 RepID=A0A3D8JUI4_9BURK|nr:PilN family type IVB pilus formation outer membrane protein [Trinickia dinghuensis]RDU96763.1 PilN family type IVB pilus formation outer membrane protein [Trinickia dinghuensis]